MADKALQKTLTKRLIPLYIAGFFQSFVLWYAIEKLFMRSIGFSNTQIGLMIAVYSAVMLVVETPSGIVADRWSRKGVLLIASVCLSFCALIGGLSHGIVMYLFAAILWGIFFACYSGMYDAIIYDCIAETSADSKLFDVLYGRCQMVDSAGLVVGGLIGGFLANLLNLRAVYFIAAPVGLLGVVALLFFREPTLHKKHAAMSLATQVRSVFQAIATNRSLVPVVAALVLRAALVYILFEFTQLWLIALHTSTQYYGIAYAVVFASLGVGGVLVSRLGLSRYLPTLFVLLVVLASCMELIVSRNTIVIVAAQFVLASALTCIYVVFSRLLHDGLTPAIRAGAASATSTVGRFFIIPLSLLFGYVSQRFSVFAAGYILLAIALLMSVFVVLVTKRSEAEILEPALALGDLEK